MVRLLLEGDNAGIGGGGGRRRSLNLEERACIPDGSEIEAVAPDRESLFPSAAVLWATLGPFMGAEGKTMVGGTAAAILYLIMKNLEIGSLNSLKVLVVTTRRIQGPFVLVVFM